MTPEEMKQLAMQGTTKQVTVDIAPMSQCAFTFTGYLDDNQELKWTCRIVGPGIDKAVPAENLDGVDGEALLAHFWVAATAE